MGRIFGEALDKAFANTGIPKSEFEISKWGRDKHGKTFPVEWTHLNGAEVNVDIAHKEKGPNAPHIGWQTAGKRRVGIGKRGHIILDEVPFNRIR